MQAANWYRRGEKLLEKRCVEEALECFRTAQRLGADSNRCAAARWQCWMLLGRFECAWAESDFIAASGQEDPHRFWDGQPWHERRLVLRCLHGLGDTIQFIRFAPLLRKTCSRLIVQAHPQLTALLEGVAGVDRVFTWGSGCAESEWDSQMEITELPRAFRTTADSVPVEIPYIRIPPHRMSWAAAQFPKRRGLRIGVCWQCGPWDHRRSIPLRAFRPLFSRFDHQVFSLQKNAVLDQRQPGWQLHELESSARDVQDTAALISHLDLVISADTMTAHLAGALGCPVWIFLPFLADWRWMLHRPDTPWYPTARLFRQRRRGDWSNVIAEAAQALARL